jgi:hypothetical protein
MKRIQPAAQERQRTIHSTFKKMSGVWPWDVLKEAMKMIVRTAITLGGKRSEIQSLRRLRTGAGGGMPGMGC